MPLVVGRVAERLGGMRKGKEKRQRRKYSVKIVSDCNWIKIN